MKQMAWTTRRTGELSAVGPIHLSARRAKPGLPVIGSAKSDAGRIRFASRTAAAGGRSDSFFFFFRRNGRK